MSKFNIHDGWTAERDEAGGVEIRNDAAGVLLQCDPGTWASIVAEVSAGRGRAEDFSMAERLHGGEAQTILAALETH